MRVPFPERCQWRWVVQPTQVIILQHKFDLFSSVCSALVTEDARKALRERFHSNMSTAPSSLFHALDQCRPNFDSQLQSPQDVIPFCLSLKLPGRLVSFQHRPKLPEHPDADASQFWPSFYLLFLIYFNCKTCSFHILQTLVWNKMLSI
jgi:hypothetical protein